MKRILIFLIITGFTFAQSAGETGLSFLKFGYGARNMALGDNGNTMASDASSMFYNPARLAITDSYEVFFMHNEWIQDISSDVLGAKFMMYDLAFGVGVNSTTIDGIQVRTRPGPAESEFDARYFMASFSVAGKITQSFIAGITYKYLFEGVYIDNANGYAFDFGAVYSGVMENTDISLSLRNIGTMNKLKNEPTRLPSDLRLGASYSYNPQWQNITLQFGAEIQKYFSVEDVHINSGAEVLYDTMISLRLGYLSMYDAKNITSGLGLRWRSLDFDYAFTPFSYGLGTAHTISLRFVF